MGVGLSQRVELELVDVYRYEGYPEKRFRFHIKGSRIYINVAAETLEEAVEKAKKIIKHLEIDRILMHISSRREVGQDSRSKA